MQHIQQRTTCSEPPKQSTGRVAKNSENGCKENYGNGKGCDAIVTSHAPANNGTVRHVMQQTVDCRVAVLCVQWWEVAVLL